MNRDDLAIGRILRRQTVEERTGLSRSTLYQYMQDGVFPAPVRLGSRAVGWRESDIQAWIAERPQVTRPSRAGPKQSSTPGRGQAR